MSSILFGNENVIDVTYVYEAGTKNTDDRQCTFLSMTP